MTWLGLLLGLAALALMWWSWRLRARSGLPAGRVVYSDTGAWRRNEQSLISRRHGIVGKPDYLVEEGGAIIPVEFKSSRAPRDGRPREGHVLQAMAYCALVEESFGRRPPYAIVRYADRQFALDYTPGMERALQRVIDDMRAALEAGDAARDHHDPARCARCGVRESCDERMPDVRMKSER